ncbi:MAG TPA: tRNA (adenosine(37)-N6)-threonylcarbamoyltransferase complex dimerization subunit type 1 TsaB [Pyrinomonadaceae bacterium]|nr:tRNA (adenosine(37)-N6)-threonylcarbamoyltransferase complex dimerization subunit type 1 TsaB [Pyrinomonadaceae bacterium]
MPVPLILSLDTATLGGSVWLGMGSVELTSRIGDPAISQSASLLSDISECLAEAGVKLGDVDLFACASGPGSFTGLRIGIATLKALSASLQRPCIGIPTLEAVAHSAGTSQASVALLPAGRGELFVQMFAVNEQGTVSELDSAAHLSPQKTVERYATVKKLRWAGGGAHAQLEFLRAYARRHEINFFADADDEDKTREQAGEVTWTLAPLETNLAGHVAALARQRFLNGETQSPASLSAIYVRPSDAELNKQCR